MRWIIVYIVIILLISCRNSQSQTYPLIAHETFARGSADWQPLFSSQWRVVEENGENIYELVKAGQEGKIRKPRSISLLTPYTVGSFELQVTAKCYTKPSNPCRDICLFFGYQNAAQFYYTHFSGASDQNHNAIHIVNNADRTKINIEPPGKSKALLKEIKWYTLKVKRDLSTGTITAFVDGEKVLSAIDSTFASGKIGIGSFDDIGAFAEIKLWGELICDVGKIKEHPSGYRLGRNYPNPFNPVTTINYTIPKPEKVNWTVYDILGKVVAVPVNENKPAGDFSLNFDGSSLTSGLYLYTLTAGEQIVTGKMLLIR